MEYPQTKKIGNSLPQGYVLHGNRYDYAIESVLGHGTFGITYLAMMKSRSGQQPVAEGLHVAIKEFFMKDLNGRSSFTVTSGCKDGAFAYYKSKFINEARNLEKLDHPNIIKVIEQFEENNTAYYAMEYIEDGSLDERIISLKCLPEKQAINYARHIGDALTYMHTNNMLHLDVKPKNIMLKKDGSIVVIDFGLSKQFDSNGDPESSTTIGQGTPGYAPIEQAHYKSGEHDTFPATMDVYAFGATIFKMITGHRPPDASNILNDGFPIEELIERNCTDSLVCIIEKCMAPLKKDRFQSVADCLAQLPIYAEIEESEDENTHIEDSVSATVQTQIFKVPSDVCEVQVCFIPGLMRSLCVDGGFEYAFHLVYMDNKKGIGLKVADFKSLIKEISDLVIEVGPQRQDTFDYSETPSELVLSFLRKNGNRIDLSVKAFNTDMLAGNIYNANIMELSHSLDRIFSKHIPQNKEQSPVEEPKPIKEETQKTPTDNSETMRAACTQALFLCCIVGATALPTYLMVKPGDEMYGWLWTMIGTGVFSSFLNSIGGMFRKSSDMGNIESLGYGLGLLSFITYGILLLIQVFYWWS